MDDWDQALMDKVRAMSNEELAQRIAEAMVSTNSLDYCPGIYIVLREAVKRLNGGPVAEWTETGFMYHLPTGRYGPFNSEREAVRERGKLPKEQLKKD